MRIMSHTSESTAMGDETRSSGQHIRARFRSSSQKGSALIEFAFVLPVLLLLVTGIASFSIFLSNYMELTDAVSTGARVLAINRGQTTDPCALTVTTVDNATPYMNHSSMVFSFSLNGTTYSKTSSCTSGAANLVQGGAATVTVTYPCSIAAYGHVYDPASSCTMTAQTTEIIQ